jgi:hypothetical protein
VESIDRSIVRCHRRASSPAAPRADAEKVELSGACKALERSHDGFTPKPRLCVDGRGRLLSLFVAACRRPKGTSRRQSWIAFRFPKEGSVACTTEQVVLDKCYSLPKSPKTLGIPARQDERKPPQSKGYRSGRPPQFHRAIYWVRI